MYLSKAIVGIFVLFFLIENSSAQSADLGKISITGAFARETVAGQTVGSGFLKIKNTGALDKLVSASTSVGSEVQIHTMSMEGNVMKMSQIPYIEIPANGSVELTPGGMHLMIMGLKGPVKVGDNIKIKLKFSNSGEVEVNFPVQAMSPHSGHMKM